jgi:hypothetical protein
MITYRIFNPPKWEKPTAEILAIIDARWKKYAEGRWGKPPKVKKKANMTTKEFLRNWRCLLKRLEQKYEIYINITRYI